MSEEETRFLHALQLPADPAWQALREPCLDLFRNTKHVRDQIHAVVQAVYHYAPRAIGQNTRHIRWSWIQEAAGIPANSALEWVQGLKPCAGYKGTTHVFCTDEHTAAVLIDAELELLPLPPGLRITLDQGQDPYMFMLDWSIVHTLTEQTGPTGPVLL